MIYKITRTSDWYGEKQPCKNAYLHKKGQKDLPDEDEWDITIEEYEWHIAINTLEDIQNLINEVGCIVLSEDNIEIYDSYRE